MQSSVSGEIVVEATFEVHDSKEISRDVCAVSGTVTEGAFHIGDIVTFMSPLGDSHAVSLLSIRKDDLNADELPEGAVGTLTLRTDPSNIMAGDRLHNLGGPPREQTTAAPPGRTAKGPAIVERPGELRAIEQRMKQGDFVEAERLLEAYREMHPNSPGAQRLLAGLCLDRASPYFDAPRGLALIRAVHAQCKVEDPAVTALLATALAENGDPEMGLHFLERTYASLIDGDMLEQWAQRIHAFREAHGFRSVWEVVGDGGEPLGRFDNFSEMAAAVNGGRIPPNALCRRNRVGQWRPVESALQEHSRQTPLSARVQKQSRPSRAITLLVVLALAAVAVFFVYQMVVFVQSL